MNSLQLRLYLVGPIFAAIVTAACSAARPAPDFDTWLGATLDKKITPAQLAYAGGGMPKGRVVTGIQSASGPAETSVFGDDQGVIRSIDFEESRHELILDSDKPPKELRSAAQLAEDGDRLIAMVSARLGKPTLSLVTGSGASEGEMLIWQNLRYRGCTDGVALFDRNVRWPGKLAEVVLKRDAENLLLEIERVESPEHPEAFDSYFTPYGSFNGCAVTHPSLPSASTLAVRPPPMQVRPK